MSNERKNLIIKDFDYEEDDYDRLKNVNKNRNSNYHQSFTNKVTLKKCEFDYEEDPYEPEKSK